ncbi:MAG TPA: hypothetical protein VGN32_18565 [Ktedonobacterales bacterium]|nr:hypothetical protein [Ktedonobacterales bacterium]
MRPLVPSTHHGWLVRHQSPSSPRHFALIFVAAVVLFGCGATTTVVTQQGGGHTTATATSAPHATPTHPISTNTPVPPPQPTATNAPTPPNIAGSYGGEFDGNTAHGGQPIQVQISQFGTSLSGSTTENEGNTVASDTGTIALNGNFTITEKVNGGFYGNLVGSIVGPGHLGGTWNVGGAAQGTWNVYSPQRPVQIYGTYSGTYTTDGTSGTNPMSLSISQNGTALSGKTFEGSTTYTDSGTIALNGSLTINEGGPVLTGGITGYGQLSGTWTGGSETGTWLVNVELI